MSTVTDPDPGPGHSSSSNPGQGSSTNQDPSTISSQSSKPRSSKGRILHSAVHNEFIQTSTRDESKKRSLVWTSQCKHCDKIIKDKLPATLLIHLKQHSEVLNKVLFLDERNKRIHDEKDKLRPNTKVRDCNGIFGK